MFTSTSERKLSLNELEDCIANAMIKVRTNKENMLCHYIPKGQGYLHHFAFNKLKKTNPEELRDLIKKYILETESPMLITSKRKAYTKVKKDGDITLKRDQFNQLLQFLKNADSRTEGAQDLIAMLSPYQTLPQVQKLMIDMVRLKNIDQDLWKTYVKLVQEEKELVQ